MPTKVLENQQLANKLMTPFPNFEGVGALLTKVFGCVSSVHVHKQLHGKLNLRAMKDVFLGYSLIKKGYKCRHPPSKKHYVTMDVTSVVNQPCFDITYLQGKNTSKWEDMWDWGVEEGLKEGTNVIAAEINDIVARSIDANMDD